MNTSNKKFVMEFIEVYRSLPCLWKAKSSEYSDRRKKSKAYEILLDKLKEVDATATIDTVKKKIETLRGSFRKELKKVIASQKSAEGPEDIHQPHLWYFEHLLFLTDHLCLTDHETPQESTPKIKQEEEFHFLDTTEDVEQSQNSLDGSRISTFSTTLDVQNPASPSLPHSRKRLKTHADHIPGNVCEQLYIKEDKFDIIGKNIACKLRDLPPEVSLFAEKFIMDILFEGAIGNITRNSKMNLYDTQPQT